MARVMVRQLRPIGQAEVATGRILGLGDLQQGPTFARDHLHRGRPRHPGLGQDRLQGLGRRQVDGPLRREELGGLGPEHAHGHMDQARGAP